MRNLFFFAACFLCQIVFVPHGQCLPPQAGKQPKFPAPHTTAPASQAQPAATAISNKWAVLIGVGRYDDPQIGMVKNANRNVVKIARVLVDPAIGRFPSNHVLVVTDDKANKNSLAQAVCQDWLFKKALPDDLILLYICMRGCPSESLDDWILLSANGTYANRAETGTSLKAMLKDVRQHTQAKNVVCLLDSQIVSSISDKYPHGLNTLLKKVSVASQTTILTADQNLLQSRDSQTEASSQFVEYFTEGLKAGGGQLSLSTIAGFIDESMKKASEPAGQKSALLLSASNPEVAQVAIGLPIKNAPSTVGLKKEEQESDDDEQNQELGEGPPIDFKPYMDAMKKAIQSKWATPSGMDQKKVVTNFSIQRDGRITEAEIVESSGNASIDKSALQALKDASPLAPLPKGSPKRVQIHYKFDYKVN